MNISIWNNLPLCLNIKNEAWQAGFLHSHNFKKKSSSIRNVWVVFVVFLDSWGWACGLLSRAARCNGLGLWCIPGLEQTWLLLPMVSFSSNGEGIWPSVAAQCLGDWWPGKEAVKVWDNFCDYLFNFCLHWINDVSSYVWHVLCMSVILIAIYHNPNA